jgi:hypothetical protein
MRTLLINNRTRLAMPTATVSAFGQPNKEACKIFGGQKCTAHSLPRKLAYVGLTAMSPSESIRCHQTECAMNTTMRGTIL